MRLFNPAAAVLLAPPLAPAAKTKPAPAIELGVPFADNANLQRGEEAPEWGWSRPATSVTVDGEARAAQGQRAARADEHQRRRRRAIVMDSR